MRTGRGLRMVLNREDREFPVAKPLHRTVIQVDVSHLQRGRARNGLLCSLDGESVVLRRDQDPPGLDLANRMISTSVPVRHLCRGRSIGQPKQLVTETDAE